MSIPFGGSHIFSKAVCISAPESLGVRGSGCRGAEGLTPGAVAGKLGAARLFRCVLLGLRRTKKSFELEC